MSVPSYQHVLVTRCYEESPAGRKTEVGNHCWAPFPKVRDVHGLEEARIVRQLYSRPDVLPGRMALRPMSQSVQRQDAVTNSSVGTDLDVHGRLGIFH